jgi:tetratricopeptide (TPR) repeat protein
MRIARGFGVALLIAAAVFAGAQAGTSPYDTRIHAQEAIVAHAPGNANGVAWLNLAMLCQDAARYDEAERAYRKAVTLLKTGDRALLADALDHLGTLYVETGRSAKAEPLEERALAIRQDTGDKGAIGTSYAHLAALEFGKKNLELAESNAEMAVSLLAPAHSEATTASAATPEEKMAALENLALIRCARGECARAIPDLTRALVLAHKHYTDSSVPVGMLDFLLGYAQWKSGNAPLATEPMSRGIQELGTQLGWGHPTYVAALQQYRAVLLRTGRSSDAAGIAEQIENLERSRTGNHTANQQVALGLIPLQ